MPKFKKMDNPLKAKYAKSSGFKQAEATPLTPFTLRSGNSPLDKNGLKEFFGRIGKSLRETRESIKYELGKAKETIGEDIKKKKKGKLYEWFKSRQVRG